MLVLIRRDQNGETQIVLLDHGLYEILPDENRKALCDFWKSIVLQDNFGMEKYASILGVKGNRANL